MASFRWVALVCLSIFPSAAWAQSLPGLTVGSRELQQQMVESMRSGAAEAQEHKGLVINVAHAENPQALIADTLLSRRADLLGRGKKHHVKLSKAKLAAANIFPGLSLAMPFDVGDVGQLGAVNVRQVLSAKEFRAEVLSDFTRASCDVIIRGLPTSGLIDNRAWSSSGQYFRVTGSARYRTLAGSRTLPVLEPFDVSEAARLFAAAIARETERKHTAAKPASSGSSPETHAKTLLSNGRKLAQAGLYAAAEKKFRQVIAEAPGTPMAADAEKELTALPAH